MKIFKKHTLKIQFSYVRRFLLVIIVLTLTFSLGYALGLKGYSTPTQQFPKVTIDRELPTEKQELNFNLFWQVWDTLELKYFDDSKIIPSEMVYGAIQGMVSSIGDPYTVFLPPSTNKVVQEDLQGSFEGVGIQIGFKGSQLVVVAPLPGTPAEREGIQAGDFIVGIKDVNKGVEQGTVGITLPEAVKLIRGPAGSVVTLSLLRNGTDDIIELDITREAIEVPSVVYESVGEEEQFTHIQVLKFGAETKAEWDEAVIEILKNPEIEGVIVDVRNNPGGYLLGAVDLASDFMEIGSVVVTEEQSSGLKEQFKVETIGRLRNYKVVVLVNEGSASASEILAGALRENEGIEIVGETTFGKGTIQEPQQVENGAGLHITVARWLTPSGYWVNDGGIVPDFEVEDNPDTSEDEQLQKAIQVVGSM
jgi:carboxyl-terminal processing protease